MTWNTVLPVVAILIQGATGHAIDTNSSGIRLKGVPAISVNELAAAMRKEGFQWRFIGRQIAFKGTVLSESPNLRVRIAEMDRDKLDTAWLHMRNTENTAKVGQQVEIKGMLVDQDYGVWRVWVYSLSVIDQSTGGKRSSQPAKPVEK